MSIHPIDLQSVYSNLTNVAKQVNHAENGQALVQATHLVDQVHKQQEEVKTVQKSDKQEDTKNVNQNGRNNQSQMENKKNKKESETPQEDRDKFRLKESFLGNNIDITG